MPGSLDSCINNVYEPGNIPASSGIPPVRVLLRDALAVAVSEAATADAVQDIDVVAPPAEAVAAMVPYAFVNSDGTPRQAMVIGAMVNL